MSDERILEVEVREPSSGHICPHFEGMSVNVFDLKWMLPKMIYNAEREKKKFLMDIAKRC